MSVQILATAISPITDNFWMSYDDISDTILIYTIGHPVPSATQWLDNHTGILLDDNDKFVGFHLDHVSKYWLNAP